MTTNSALKKLAVATAGAAAMMAVGSLNMGEANATTISGGGYTATDTIPYQFQDISATGTRVLAGQDDAYTSAILGFNFSFFGNTYNSTALSTNGWLKFGNPNFSDLSNVNITNTNVGNNLPTIAAFWDDITFGAGGDAIYYQTVGTAGSQRFITQWNQERRFSAGPGTATFQAVLFEGSNDILVSYLDAQFGNSSYDFGKDATVGIRDTDGHLNGSNLQWSYNQAVIGNQTSICFNKSGGNCSVAKTPEPGSVLGLLALGGMVTASVLKRKKQQNG